MRIYDISVGVSPDLPVWPGDPPVRLERVHSLQKGADANVSRLATGVHAGTHVDAPLHFFADGGSVEGIPLKRLIGRAYVVHLAKASVIDARSLEKARIPPRTKRLLFRTQNSGLWASREPKFHKDYVAVDPSGAEWLVHKGVYLVGVDYLSVAPFEGGTPTHRILLEAGVVILEGLDLREVRQGRYTLYCLPLKLVGSEGAPARAILVGV
jgi:arylformamidase